jgi:hypothetical protein
MKRFIAFIAFMLPVVAILSTFAGIAYGTRLRQPAPRPQVLAVQEVAPVAPVVVIPTATPRPQSNYASLMRIQLSFCFQAFNGMGNNPDPARVNICAANIREMTPPAEWATAHQTALALADELDAYAADVSIANRDTDPARLDTAIKRIQPIGDMFKQLVDVLPE